MLKRAIVVGASSGIGAGVVRRLARQGYRVAAIARRKDRLDELCAEAGGDDGRVLAFAHDVRQIDEVEAVFASGSR